MSGFLSRVVDERRAEMASLAGTVDRGKLVEAAAAVRGRDFVGALKAARHARGAAVIAEFKRRSPSTASFPNAVDPAGTARLYADHGAAALSVVADEAHFDTTLDDAAAARAACGLPLLVKDFVIDPLQALRARAAGADALLLIARVLSRGELTNLLGAIGELGMTALVECHDETDVAAALTAGAPLIGVNCRNLETLEVDPAAHDRLLPLLRGRAVAVAESGLRSGADVAAAAARGADAVLIGGALLNADDPAALLRDMTGLS